MITKQQKQLAQWAIEFALKNGCQATRVNLYSNTNSSFEVRNAKIDRLSQASESGFGIHVFVDGRFGSFSTNRLEKSELETFIKNGIDAARFLAEDKARVLPDSSLYYKGELPDLQLLDSTYDSIHPDRKVELATNACEEVMGQDKRILSVTGTFSDNLNNSYMLASNGFEGEKTSSSFALEAIVSIKVDGDARPESYWYDSSIFFNSLTKEGIGQKALARTLSKLGQNKAASGKYQMLVDNLHATQLVSPLITALYGSSIQQKDSFLLDKLGQKVVGTNVSLVDEPHRLQSFGARYFDSEGIATRTMPIFQDGTLQNYFIDTYYGNKLQTPPTVGSPSILVLRPGSKDIDAMLNTVDKGILVTGFNGGNSNSSTGDFSYGIEGFLIEKGKLSRPVNEMNITGNLLSLWNNLVDIGNDPCKMYNWQIPSLLFDNVDFSGF
jgi:PmbA protein